MRNRVLAPLALALALLAVACNPEQADLTTTSSLITGTTEAADSGDTTTTTEAAAASTTTLVGETVATYEVVARISSDNGETLYILIPEGAYTDIDLEQFVGDLKESDPQLFGAEVFDDEQAVQAFPIPEAQRTEAQQQLLDDHHLISLVGGNTIVFRGPFEHLGEQVIGS
ncbi:MAG: hypothetical protein ACRDVL_00220 [Acidimicrobiia bacterium]